MPSTGDPQSAIGSATSTVSIGRQFESDTLSRAATTAVPKMRYTPGPSRLVVSAATAALLALVVGLTGCGSSGKTFTSPSAVSKCAVSFDAPGSPLPATGGSGAIAVKT